MCLSPSDIRQLRNSSTRGAYNSYMALSQRIPRNTFLCVLLITFLANGCSVPVDQAKRYYDRGIRFGIQGKFAAAKVEFTKALAIKPLNISPIKAALRVAEDASAGNVKKQAAVHIFKGTY